MKKDIFEAKTKEEAITLALNTLNANSDEVIIVEREVKKTLFSKKAEIMVVLKEEINKEVKNYISNLLKNMNIDGNIETKTKEDIPTFNILSSKSILIGRNGRTLDAIQNLVNAYLKEELEGAYYKVIIDVNDYKQSRKIKLEKLAKYTAKQVAKTKIEAKLDPMNSFERRIIHSALSESNDVMTKSYGEEPNRYVVISLKDKTIE